MRAWPCQNLSQFCPAKLRVHEIQIMPIMKAFFLFLFFLLCGVEQGCKRSPIENNGTRLSQYLRGHLLPRQTGSPNGTRLSILFFLRGVELSVQCLSFNRVNTCVRRLSVRKGQLSPALNPCSRPQPHADNVNVNVGELYQLVRL